MLSQKNNSTAELYMRSNIRKQTQPDYNNFHPEIRSFLIHHSEITSHNKLQRMTSLLKHFDTYLKISSLGDASITSLQENQLNQFIASKSELKIKYIRGIITEVKKVLHHYGMFNYDHILSIKLKEPIKKEQDNCVILEFISYLENFKKFSQTITNKKHLIMFYKFLINCYPQLQINAQSNFSNITLEQVNHFQRYQLERASLKRITKIYVYAILRSVRMFIDYLRKKDIIEFKYYPPSYLQRNRNRANEYVEEKDIRAMIECLLEDWSRQEHSKFKFRNLAMFLIILSTGCRPIELCNINVSDIWFTEGAILLRSKKSGQRKLKLHREVVYYLKVYLDLRNRFGPTCEKLFVKRDGSPIDYRIIYKVFKRLNKKVFNKVINTPKSFRHTYITNALDSLNDIKVVAEAAGHKIWSSTDYYRFRSIERLKKNTIEHDPTLNYEEEFNYGHS